MSREVARTDSARSTVPDRMEDVSYAIERYSPWFGFVERFRSLRFGSWTIRYWQGGSRFRWRMLRTTLACGTVAALLVVLLNRA